MRLFHFFFFFRLRDPLGGESDTGKISLIAEVPEGSEISFADIGAGFSSSDSDKG